jgi:hypothetical protein
MQIFLFILNTPGGYSTYLLALSLLPIGQQNLVHFYFQASDHSSHWTAEFGRFFRPRVPMLLIGWKIGKFNANFQ